VLNIDDRLWRNGNSLPGYLDSEFLIIFDAVSQSPQLFNKLLFRISPFKAGISGKRLSIPQKYNMRKDDLIRLFHMLDAA